MLSDLLLSISVIKFSFIFMYSKQRNFACA